VNAPDDELRQSLSAIADQVGPVDLYEGSLRRSRRIGRRRTAITSLATVLLVALGGTVAVRAGLDTDTTPPITDQAPPSAGPARSVPGLPGTLVYRDPQTDRLVSPAPDGRTVVVATGIPGALDVSPDGTRLAYADEAVLHTLTLPGGKPVTVPGGIDPDDVPSFSPDGTRLLLTRTVDGQRRAGSVELATGRFTALPATVNGTRLRWSGDGRSIVYRTPQCRLVVVAADGSNPVTVPSIGDDDRAVNPNGYAACKLVGVSRDASRLAVTLSIGATGEPGSDPQADTTVSAATGAVAVPPVEGAVEAVLFRPDGTMLVRSTGARGGTLTLLTADDTIIAQVTEPAAVREFDLVAHTR
jgi:TolB protein